MSVDQKVTPSLVDPLVAYQPAQLVPLLQEAYGENILVQLYKDHISVLTVTGRDSDMSLRIIETLRCEVFEFDDKKFVLVNTKGKLRHARHTECDCSRTGNTCSACKL